MNFILLIMFGYLFLKYRDIEKELLNYIGRVEHLEDITDEYLEEEENV